MLGRLVAPVLLALCASAKAQTPPTAAPQSHLESITVEAARHRELIERQVRSFVANLAFKPYDSPLARWQTVAPICPLVAGLSREDGEFILMRVSKIAATAGAPLAGEHCKPNLYIVVSADPDALLKAWSRRDVWMFGDEPEQGGTRIRKFLHANSPIRAWYNAELYSAEGIPRGNGEARSNANVVMTGHAEATRLVFNDTRDLTSVLIMVDGQRAKGVNFGQLAAYIALIGLAEIRSEADPADAPTILHLFSSPETDRPAGLSMWDEAFLKALYHTRHNDKQQLAEMKTAMVQDIAPQ